MAVVEPTFAPAVPPDAPLVARSKGSTRVLAVVMLVAVVLEVVLLAAVGLLVYLSGFPMFLAVLPLLLLQLGLMVVVLREYQGLLGPQLAANASGVWVRTGLGRKPEVVHLPWPAIDAIDVARGPALRIMSRQGDALFARRAHWRVRSLRRRFGTPFIVDGRRSATEAHQLAAMLDSFGRSGTNWSMPPGSDAR
ncbi:hypothetical protein EV186_105231 [Labedaea rhizosphaerae]|uniref:PH (Pleckstrin Homology) domain-containing protein n=1 Tax=Labedaea rhizosphaerae TaxID=598644 RepID=A0A4R6S5C3_LABRH|nr:hypothetical protein EV186_105231 [Labedaea rhizosphaerae]